MSASESVCTFFCHSFAFLGVLRVFFLLANPCFTGVMMNMDLTFIRCGLLFWLSVFRVEDVTDRRREAW